MKRSIILSSVLVCLLLGGILVYYQYQNNGVTSVKGSAEDYTSEVLSKNADTFLRNLTKKMEEQGFEKSEIPSMGIRVPPDEEITITVNGTQQHVNKVKGDIKDIIHKLKQDTMFNDYPIRVNRKPESSVGIPKYTPELNALLSQLAIKVQEGLKTKGYEEVEGIVVEKNDRKVIINVNTSIHSTTVKRGKEVEEAARKSLKHMEIMSRLVSKNETVDVNVYNNNKQKIN